MRLAVLVAAATLAGCGQGFIKKDAGGCADVATSDGRTVEVCESAPREAPPEPPPPADGGGGAGQGQGAGQ